MIDIFTTLLLQALLSAPLQKEVPIDYIANYDGDHVTVTGAVVPGVLFEDMIVRIDQIDAPEIEGRCDLETRMAASARNVLEGMLKRPNVELRMHLDGRTVIEDGEVRPLARITVDDQDVSEELIRLGMVRRLDAGHPVRPWCPLP